VAMIPRTTRRPHLYAPLRSTLYAPLRGTALLLLLVAAAIGITLIVRPPER